MQLEEIRSLALGFDEVVEQPHFEKKSFRVRKKIFATLDEQGMQLVLKLSETDQSVFSNASPNCIYPVKGGWGRQGWTLFDIENVNTDLLTDAITTAYRTVAPAKLGDKYRPKDI